MERNKTIFKGGVLIIGSLIWEKSELRDKWRNENLDIDNQTKVELPIRYGRISRTRKGTYTMVFSSDCKTKLGQGIFVPFKKDLTIEQILKQGKPMIEAEHNKEVNFERFYWGWGCLGILTNPKTELEIEESWKAKYGNGFNQNQYNLKDEEPIVSNIGKFNFKWPTELDECDFAIGTATKPNIDTYPNAEKIAKKIVENNYYEYFSKNLESGIKTFQDQDIKSKIEELRKQ